MFVILMRVVGVILILLAIISFTLSRPFVQNYMAGKLTDFLKERYDIDSEIKTARFRLPNRLDLTGVYIQDEHQDTMIYAERLKLVYSGFDTERNQLNAQRIELENGRLYMRKHQEDSLFNFAMFIEKFAPEEPVDDPKPFNLKVGKVRISDFRYTKHRLGCDTGCTNLFLTDATVNVDDFQLLGDYVSADVKKISYRDEQRFDVYELTGQAAYQSKYISLRNFYIKTEQSELDGDVQLLYDSPDELSDFLAEVRIKGHFNRSTVSSDEFISYIPQFPQFDNFTFSGLVDGTINHLEVENAVVDMGERTRFFGNIELTEPANSDNLFIEASIGELSTTPEEYVRYVSQFTGEMEWVKYLEKFSTIEYRGKYNGTISDFDVNGWLKFDQNEVVVNAHMNGFDNLNTATYKGRVEAKRLNLKQLYRIEDLGFVSFDASVEGQGLLAESVKANVEGNVNYADVYGYRYQNLKIDGIIQEKQFDGEIVMNDPHAKLDFDGMINFSSDTLVTNFKAEVGNADLHAIGISKQETSILNAISDIDFKFYKDTWWDGNLRLYDITYESPDRFYFFDTIKVVSSINGNYHDDRLISNLAIVNVEGDYSFQELADAFKAEYARFNRLSGLPVDRPDVNFTYDFQLINTAIVTELFLPQLYVEPGSRVFGEYSYDRNFFEVDVLSDFISWNKQRIHQVTFRAEESDSIYGLNVKIGSIQSLGQYVDSVSFVSRMQDDSLSFATNGILRDSIDSEFRLNGVAYDISNEDTSEFNLIVKDGRFNIGDNYFNLIENNLISFQGGEVEFDNVGFYDQNSSIVIDGHRSQEETKVLRLSASNLDADILNYVLRYPQIIFQGVLDGDMIISNSNGKPKFASDAVIDSFFVNDRFLGRATLFSNWELNSGIVSLEAKLTKGELDMFHAVGSYYPDSTGIIDFDVDFDKFRLNWIDPLVVGVFENVRGLVSGKVKMSGTVDNIKTKGELTLERAALGVPYFSTDYSFQGGTKVLVDNGKLIVPDGTTFKDTKEGTTGFVSGEITHSNFDDWNFDLKANSTNLFVMDTENSSEAYFYGKAYVTGTFEVTGPLEDLAVNVDITTNKGTNFKIPFSNPTSVTAHDFITFVGRTSTETIIIDTDKIENELKPLGGLDINIIADITQDAKIELVMDETVGDVISGRGNGTLRMEIPHDGDIAMFGTVVIVSGDYLFTMRNIINKKFKIKQGGTLTWDGDPYKADMKMNAIYSTRSALTGFVTSDNYEGQRVQVDLNLKLAGPVMNPNIDFKIDLPNSQASWQDELDNRLSDQDKRNEQAFSLLLINSFWPGNIEGEEGFIERGVGSNTMQMASTQFSNWLAQGIGDFIDISVGYNTAQSSELTDEVEVDISKDFFNDRVTVNSRIDVPVGSPEAGTRNQDFTGDIEVIYKVTPDGRIRAKAFNRSNQDNPALDNLSPYTQGVGIFYQTNFNTYGELWQKLFGKKEKDVQTEESPNEDGEEPTTTSSTEEPN